MIKNKAIVFEGAIKNIQAHPGIFKVFCRARVFRALAYAGLGALSGAWGPKLSLFYGSCGGYGSLFALVRLFPGRQIACGRQL